MSYQSLVHMAQSTLEIKAKDFENQKSIMWLLENLNKPIPHMQSGRKVYGSGQQLSVLFQSLIITKEAIMRP